MAKVPSLVVTIRINCDISFWQAIKLRIAGKAVKTVLNEIAEECKKSVAGHINGI